MNTSPLSIKNLTVHYDNKIALWDIHYEAPEASLIGILGPNGAGKTTLIKAILGIIRATSGSITIFDRPLQRTHHMLSYVPQRGTVDWDYPITALELVCMGLYRSIGWFRRVQKKHWEKAYHALEQVGMQSFAHRQIGALSGGQQQRIFIARALVQDASIYFMDEPFAGVDAKTEASILILLRTLKKEKKTIFVVHHDLSSATKTFDHIILLNTTIIANGTVKKTMTPEYLKRTFGSSTTLYEEETALQ